MTIRARLAVAFFLLVLGPLVVGLGLIIGALAGGRTDPAPRQAAIAVRAAVSARCDALAATARALAVRAARTGVPFVARPAGNYGPLAICDAGPSPVPLTPGTRYGALAARAEIYGDEGALVGYAYALQPLDEAYLGQLSAAAGRPVSIHPTGGSASMHPAGRFVPAHPSRRSVSAYQTTDASGPYDLEPDAVSPLPLTLGPADTGAGSVPATAIAVIGTALALASIFGWWLAGIATRPLATLLSAVELVAAGDLSARSRVRGRDEAGRLGSGLDRLIAGMQESQRLSLTDPLTGLGNLRQLRESLRMEVERATRFRRAVGVLVIDLDHFKLVNDRHGHRAGDAVLVEFAWRVRRVVREVDLVFRQGGEEFVILLPETDVAGSLTAASRIVAAVRDRPFSLAPGAVQEQAAPSWGHGRVASETSVTGETTAAKETSGAGESSATGQITADGLIAGVGAIEGAGPTEMADESAVRVAVTVSVGVSVFPYHGGSGSEVLDAADGALYAAKAAGRDTYVLATAAALGDGWQAIRPAPTQASTSGYQGGTDGESSETTSPGSRRAR